MNQEEQLIRSNNKNNESPTEIRKENSLYFPDKEDDMNRSNSMKNDEQKDDCIIMNSNNENIFNKLYIDHYVKSKTAKVLEEIKQQKELSQCTFKPVIQNFPKNKGNSNNVFERLNRKSLEDKFLILSEQKKELETKYCTFKPEVPKAKHSKDKKEDVFERLHNQGYMKKYRIENNHTSLSPSKKLLDEELKNQERQLKVSSPSFQNFMKRVAKELEVRNENLSKMGQTLSDKIKNQCTFHPKILNITRFHKKKNESSIFERLYNIKSEHDKKLEKTQISKEREENIRNELLHRKSIITNSKDIVMTNSSNQFKKRNSENIFDKLYNNHKEIQKNKQKIANEIMVKEGCVFSPKINEKSLKILKNTKMKDLLKSSNDLITKRFSLYDTNSLNAFLDKENTSTFREKKDKFKGYF